MLENVLPKNYRRNFCCLTVDFCFFGVAMAFFSTTTVVPGFLSVLGASTAVIGLTTTLQRAGWLLPQLFAARYLADKPFKKPYIIIPAGISRALLLVLALVIALTRARPESLIVAIVVFTIALFFLGDGLASLPWFDFLSKAIPPNRRGRLTGTGQVLSGIFGFAAGFLVEWLLSDRGPTYPTNYTWIFLIAFVMLTVSLIGLALGVEEAGEVASSKPRWRDYLPQLWQVFLRDRAFRNYIIARQVFGLSSLAVPFYMTYALDVLGLPPQVAGRYTSIGVVGGIVAAVLFGWTNERHGTKRAIGLSIWVTALIPVIALLISRLPASAGWLAWGYGLVFFALNFSMSSNLPGWIAYVLELASEIERPLYVGLTNTLNGLTTVFAFVGGLILQWSNGNYSLLFLLTAVGTLLALPFALMLPEPRELEGAASVASVG